MPNITPTGPTSAQTPVLAPGDTTHPTPVPIYVIGGTGGLGGPVTIADGADVTQGALADVAVVTDAAGSVSAKLRGLVTIALRMFALGTPVRVDPTGGTAQPVTAASLPLPTGAATSAQIGEVQTSPTANTVLDRLKQLLTGIVLAAGSAVIGAVTGGTASGSSLTANPITTGGLAKTALPTAVADGQVVNHMVDKFGRKIVIAQAPRDLVATAAVTISASTGETTIAAQVASTFLDLVAIFVANTSATAVRVDFRDTTGGTIIFSLYAPAGATTGFMPPVPIPQTTVNTNWTAQSSASVTDLRVFLQFVKNK